MPVIYSQFGGNLNGGTSEIRPNSKLPSEAELNALGAGARIPEGMPERSGWDVYNKEAKKVDMELVKDWTTSLNFLLIFAAIFAAVLTAFIIDSKKLLEQDPTKVMADVMIFYTNSIANGTHTPYTPANFHADPTDVIVNCLFYASLSASLVAALASVVALQWVANYDAVITRGGSSPKDRAKRRQFRYAGVISWRMSEIIATLPLLLYLSVILFFAGLIVWMWNINRAVGAVITTGAIVAVLFYSTSTLIAVVFVSSPFQTPLSKWIYSLSYLPFSSLYRLARAMRTPTIPSWLEKQHLTYIYAHKREDKAVESRPHLKTDLLVWLANQLSISQNSYRSLLNLVCELFSLQQSQMPSFKSSEAPWYEIFDLLGGIYLSNIDLDNIGEEHRRGMEILHRCHQIPLIKSLIAPPNGKYYHSQNNHIDYWSQFCDESTSGLRRTQSPRPNRLFLLLRDIPSTTGYSIQEVETLIRLAHWRNHPRKPAVLWDMVVNMERDLPSTFFAECVTTFANFTRTPKWYLFRAQTKERYVSIARNILQIVKMRHPFSPEATISLIQAYEALMSSPDALRGTNPAEAVISLLERGTETHNRSESESMALEAMSLILSRTIDSCSGVDRKTRVQGVLAMLWLRTSDPLWRGQSDTTPTRTQTGRLHPGVTMDWVKRADQIPDIMEILHHLAKAQDDDPTIGPLWRSTLSNTYNDSRLMDALHTFDRLIEPDCARAGHLALINLVCHELESEHPPDFDSYFNSHRVKVLNLLRDSCLRTLAHCARGIDFMQPMETSLEYRQFYHNSFVRIGQYILRKYPNTNIPNILELQASLWPFAELDSICMNAMQNPDIFAHLQRVFRYPVTVVNYTDGRGLLVFQILLSTQFAPSFTGKVTLFTSIEVNYQWTLPLYILLCMWCQGERLPLEQLLPQASEGSLRRLREEIDTITSSQSLILVFILNVCQANQFVTPETLAIALASTQKALLLPYDPESISFLVPLSQRLLCMLGELERSTRTQRHIPSEEAKRTRLYLVSSLASRTIYGLHNGRNLSCVRAAGNIQPATGWLPVYES